MCFPQLIHHHHSNDNNNAKTKDPLSLADIPSLMSAAAAGRAVVEVQLVDSS
jgi:hypothetical protein